MNKKLINLYLTLTCLVSSLSMASSLQQIPGSSVSSKLGAVSTVHPLATEYAFKQLESGGNAVDAAIAAALALGVVDGYNSGIGGGLFAIIHWADGSIEAIDAREMAPARAHSDMYIGVNNEGKKSAIKHLSKVGALAIGIPGSVAAFDYLAKKHGNKEIANLYQGAADIAEQGFTVSKDYHRRIKRVQKYLKRFPSSAAIFLNKELSPLSVGSMLKQPDLANTYRKIAKQGANYFYQGEFAQLTENWMRNNQGLIDAKDFANYELKFRKPIISDFLGYQITGFPPPSSGGTHVAQILNLLQQFDLQHMPIDQYQNVLVESMKLAFADRAYWLGDPDFTAVPNGLISKQYAEKLAKRINLERASQVTKHSTPDTQEMSQEKLFDKHTTHIATADKYGNWVSITSTINTTFGSKVVIPNTGVIMNNQMDDFAAQPNVPNAFGLVGSQANSVQPKKRPLSSMSPTIVLNDGKPILAIGAAGGPMIITQVVQGLVNHLAWGDTLYTSINKPRIHQQWKPDKVFFDKKLPKTQQSSLRSKGHKLKQLRYEGSTNAVSFDTKGFNAVSEPRLVDREQ